MSAQQGEPDGYIGATLGPIDHDLEIDAKRLWVRQYLTRDEVALGLADARIDGGSLSAKTLGHCLDAQTAIDP